jgi:hypothetical protein
MTCHEKIHDRGNENTTLVYNETSSIEERKK